MLRNKRVCLNSLFPALGVAGDGSAWSRRRPVRWNGFARVSLVVRTSVNPNMVANPLAACNGLNGWILLTESNFPMNSR
jgi:hypothetical protein